MSDTITITTPTFSPERRAVLIWAERNAADDPLARLICEYAEEEHRARIAANPISKPCSICGRPGYSRTGVIEPGTLRRRFEHRCDEHHGVRAADHDELRQARTMRDWEDATDPIDAEAVALGLLPEQYPSAVRRAIRAFMDSDATSAVVPNVAVSNVNASLAVLGLSDVWAEQRGGDTVLRRSGVMH